MTTITEYDRQAEKFLQDTDTEFKAEFLYNGPYWDGEKEKRDIYEITLSRGKNKFPFRFGQSIVNSKEDDSKHVWRNKQGKFIPNKRTYPTPYDLLACLTKYDPGTFKEFCSEFGYDTDSRKAEKTYFAVQEEYSKVRKLFSPDEIEQLAEIS